MLANLYHLLLTQPLLNLLVALYALLWDDMGLAIIAITTIIRLILYPSFKHQLESQKKLSALQPQIQQVRERFANDREQQSRALMELYRQQKVNPFSSCLPLIVQLIILIALYRVFLTGLNGQALQDLYSFVPNPGSLNPISLGFLNLSERNFFLALVTGLTQYWQSKMMVAGMPKTKSPGTAKLDMSALMSKQMLYFFPVITVVIGAQLPAGLALYWLITTLFSIVQQYFIMKDKQKTEPEKATI